MNEIIHSKDERIPIAFELDGSPRRGTCEPRMLLSDFLRDEVGHVGVRVGCEHGVCGACTIRVDGKLTRACLLLAVQADGCRVETVSSLAPHENSGTDEPGGVALSGLQQAFQAEYALQCGYCIPGILMSLATLLEREPNPDEDRIRDVLSGHLCRCTGYASMVRAALRYVATRDNPRSDRN